MGSSIPSNSTVYSSGSGRGGGMGLPIPIDNVSHIVTQSSPVLGLSTGFNLEKIHGSLQGIYICENIMPFWIRASGLYSVRLQNLRSIKEMCRHKKLSFESQRSYLSFKMVRFYNRCFFRLLINGVLHSLVISKFMTRLVPQYPQSTYTSTRGDAILWGMLDPA